MKINSVNLSIIIPVFNEQNNVSVLTKEILDFVKTNKYSFEIIFIDDGSTDNTLIELSILYKKYSNKIRIIKFRTNFGKSAAYDAGFQLAKGDVIATLDGDGQDDPKELGKMILKLNEEYDLVTGWRQIRKDNFVKSRTSLLFNWVTSRFSFVKLHDYNCGMKVYTKEAAKSLRLYGDLHRYIPVLLAANGFKVTEIKVNHRKRFSGKSKYGSLRFINGFLDLFTVISISKFRSRPMHFFGYIGLVFFSLGCFFSLYLIFVKYFYDQKIGDRPLLLFSVMLMIMGVQIAVTGLVGEYTKMSVESDRSAYNIKETI